MLIFKIPTILLKYKDMIKTKTKFLRFTASIFDHLGRLAPVVLSLKINFQNMCKQESDWDSKISGDILKEWDAWRTGAKNLYEIQIPPCYANATEKKSW